MSKWQVAPELTDEMIAGAIARLGCTEEDVRREWTATQELNATGGPDAVMADMGKHVAKATEEIVDAMVEGAQVALNSDSDRFIALGEYYSEMTDSLSRDGLDVELLLMTSLMAAWKLAEAKQSIATLMDGNRREKG
jgi:hypothetical protein